MPEPDGPPVIVAGWMDFAPADRDVALRAFSSVVAASREEPGCIDYAFSPDADVPGRVRVFEHWVSDAALTEHLTLPHVQELRAAIAGLTRTGREMTHHTLAASRPMGSTSSAAPDTA
ncbi:putative quinol monooxygenase [Trujillonella humicola]|uniref:putative quinol monooxygenase n=1 Tax=Trujillonella humicola TaxID=3383699 RepID=UPI003905ECC0